MKTKYDLNRAASKSNLLSIAVIAGIMLMMQPVPASASRADDSKRPNFLIILGDDISWPSFGCENPGAFTKTPNIDKLAKEGLRFSNFYCSSAVCMPVRHELYTSLLPPTSGMYNNINDPKHISSFLNVNNYLGQLGYVTGLAGKNHFKTKYPAQKIDGFSGDMNGTNPTWDMAGVKEFVGKAVEEQKNFCVFICSVHAHHPWTMGDKNHFPVADVTVPPFMVDTPKTREALSIYSAEVEEFDKQVGAAMRMLEEMKLQENTLVIVLSEQGMELPHGKYTLYNFGTRALNVMRWPKHIAAGTTTPAVSMYCDIVPTLIDIAGGKQPEGIDGRSMRQVLMGKTTEHRKYAFLVDGDYQRAIAGDRYKLIWTPRREELSSPITRNINNTKFAYSFAWKEWLEAAKTDPDAKKKVDHYLKHPLYELYDIQKDPYEMVNLADDPRHAETLKKMTEDLKLEIAALKDSMK